MKDKLIALANQYGSDKASLGYMPLYEEYFLRQKFAPENIRNVLEIGTNKGSSLRIWAEIFPNARIDGIDITRQYEIASNLDHPRINTHILDSGDPIAMLEFAYGFGGFDIIIDDGSHEQSDQQIAWGTLFHCLRSGGLYVIEDLITGENWWDGRVYNKRNIVPTRDLIQELQRTGNAALVHTIPEDEWSYIINTYSYCEYRETPIVIYDAHHPQIAFIGKK